MIFFCLKEMVFDKQIVTSSNQITTIFIHPAMVYCLCYRVVHFCDSLCVCGVFLVFLVEENSKLCMLFFYRLFIHVSPLEIQL
jgi:hypothetical protein